MSITIDRLLRSRRKTIALVVEQDGSLTVRAPLQLPEDRIRLFVEDHARWITKNKTRALKYAPPPPVQFRQGEMFLFLGQAYPLHIIARQRSALVFDGEKFLLARSALPGAQKAFVNWYRHQAAILFKQRVGELSRQFGLRFQKIRISSARTRWGSCSSLGTLSFTWRLVMAPPIVMDYVIIHELVHTRHRNHSKTFWASVAELMPDYKLHILWLKQNGRKLTIQEAP